MTTSNANISSPAFPSLLDACEHLKSAGYRVSKSKMYRDKDKGFIRVESDGSVLESEVRAYAAEHLPKLRADISDLNDIHAIKTAREVERLEKQNEKLQFELDRERGRYVPREELDLKMVGILTVLDVSFRQMADLIMPDLCHILGGNVLKINQGRDFFEKKLDETMNQLSRTDSFSVMFEGEG